jgi:S-adenosylmethionine decarboxylase proenzyme
MNGTHIMGTLYQCGNLPDHLDIEPFKKICSNAGFLVVGEAIHHFEPQGTTLTVLLGESHLNIHTWPENKAVMFDVFTCNHTRDNSAATENIASDLAVYFGAGLICDRTIDRERLFAD